MGRLYKLALQESEILFANCLKEKRELKEYYKKIGDKKAYEAAKHECDEFLAYRTKQINKMLDNLMPDRSKSWDFSKEREVDIFAENENIVLTAFKDTYKEGFIKIKRETTIFNDKYYDKPENAAIVWGYTQVDYSLYMAIIRKADNQFLGYLSINDTSRDEWEFAIELLSEYCNQGYGMQSLPLFLRKISEITNKEEFIACVEPDNIASQLLIEKIGGELVGLHLSAFAYEEDAAVFENNHLDEITDRMKIQAAKLGVDPRKIISHVLKYKLRIMPDNSKE